MNQGGKPQHRAREPSAADRGSAVFPALVAFLITAALGPLLGWSTRDVVWGLLLTSFAACVLGLVLGAQSGLRVWLPRLFSSWSEHKGGTLALVGVAGFMASMVFLAVAGAVVMLHTIYAFVVYALFPFWPATPNPFDLSSEQQFAMLARVATDYWPFAAIALARDWRRQLRPLHDPSGLDVLLPLRRLGRTHLFMILAMAVAGAAGTGLAFYWLVLLFYFFPWDTLALRQRIGRWRRERKARTAPVDAA